MRRSLVSLCVVTAIWDRRQHDYLDNFVPFIATLLEIRRIRRIEQDEVSVLCEQFEKEFDLKIPLHPMLSVLNRCVRRHLLRRIQGGYTINEEVVGDLSLSPNRDDFIRRYRELIEQFIEYVKDNFEDEIDSDKAEEALLQYLHRYDMDILFSNSDRSAIPNKPKAKHDKRIAYMLSQFAIYAHTSQPDLFDTLSDIALGNVITSAVLLDDYNWPSDTVRKSNIYLDSPIILRMIGTAGEGQATAFCDFISTLLDKGAKLWIFEHSKQEALQILEGARYWVGSPDFNPELASRTALFFRQQGYTDSEIERFILRVDNTLKLYRIEVFSQHPYMENKEYQVDERHIKGVIEECYGISGSDQETYEDRTLKDVASIAAVYRLRAGRRTTLLREAKHVFVSINASLSFASKKALCDQKVREIPVCVTDVFLGTIMWINSPREAKKAARSRLIADFYAAVAPNAALEARIIQEARQLRDREKITEDDFLLLTTSFVTKDLLSKKTFNDPELLDSSTSFEILEDIKEVIRKEERSKTIEAELEREREQLARKRAEKERDKMSEKIGNIRNDKARRKANFVNAIHAIGVGLLVILPSVMSLFWSPWAIIISVVLALFTAGLSFVMRFTLKSNYDRLFSRYLDQLERRS